MALESEAKLQVRDVVRLISSPQRMAVEAVSADGVVSCVWLSDATGAIHRARFSPETLVLVYDTCG